MKKKNYSIEDHLNEEISKMSSSDVKADYLQSYILEQIIPEMNLQIRDGKNKPKKEIYKKLFSENKEKPGELYELMEAFQYNFSKEECLSEIADSLYYSIDFGSNELTTDIFNVSKIYGVNKIDILKLTIIKYDYRMSNKKNKLIENDLLKKYIISNNDYKNNEMKFDSENASLLLEKILSTDYDY